MRNAPAQLDSEIPGAIPAISLAIRLRLAREHRAVSQIELADELGLGLSTVQRYEQGRYVPTKAVALAWAMATGTSSRWLLGDDFPPTGPRRRGPNQGTMPDVTGGQRWVSNPIHHHAAWFRWPMDRTA